MARSFWDWWNNAPVSTVAETEGTTDMADAESNHAVTNDVQGKQEQPYGVYMGVTARDIITGFTGFVVSRDLHLSGTVQFTLQPPCESNKTDKIPHAYPFDGERLAIVDDGPAILPTPLDHYTIQLGQEVQDCVSGFKGMVVEIIEQFNGCVHVRALSKVIEGDKTSGTYITLDHKRFTVLGAGVSQSSPEPIETSETGCCRDSSSEQRDRF